MQLQLSHTVTHDEQLNTSELWRPKDITGYCCLHAGILGQHSKQSIDTQPPAYEFHRKRSSHEGKPTKHLHILVLKAILETCNLYQTTTPAPGQSSDQLQAMDWLEKT